LLWTRPSSRGWTEPCELAVCMLPAACPRRRADPPSPESRAEPVACRCRCRHRRGAPFPCDRVVPLFRRVSSSLGLPPAPTQLSTRHRAKALPFLGQESCEHKHLSCALPRLPSTCLCPIVMRMLSAFCNRHGCAADVLPAHTTTGPRPCSSWTNLCTRTHTHARSFVDVCA
jgi:hypothetical protein